MEKPDTKVTAYTGGAALGTVVIGIAVWMGAVDPSPMLEGGLATFFGFLFGYFVPDNSG